MQRITPILLIALHKKKSLVTMASAPPSEFDGITPLIPPTQAAPPSPSEISEESIARLQQQGFTRGLALSLNSSKKTFSKRIWVVDNSGSMQASDGHKLVATGRQANQVALVPSSRWEEIQVYIYIYSLKRERIGFLFCSQKLECLFQIYCRNASRTIFS